jgi:hypothetical protein
MVGSLGGLEVSINANLARFEAGFTRAQYVVNSTMKGMTGSVRGLQSSVDALPGSLLRVAATVGGLTTIAMVFKKAISAADEFKVATIGIAAGLTNIAKPGQGDFGDIFKRNLVFANEMAKKLEEVAAKQFAEPAEMMMAYNQFVQQGYAVTLKEADALGIVVDRIKLATQGQDANRQINQEIRALMQGQAVAGSMIAQELQTRLGPAWADIVNKHREAGDLLEFLAGLWPGMAAATDEVQKTLMAQGSTLQGHLKYLGREGLGGAYDEIVAFTRQINEYLKDHGKELAGNIATGWNAVKDVAGGVLTVVKGIYDWLAWAATPVTFLVNKLNEAAKAPGVLEGMMGETAPIGGLKERRLTIPPPKAAAIAGPPPEVAAPRPPGGKGGGGAESAQRKLEDFINRMKTMNAKAASESFTVLEEWYRTETTALQRLEDKVGTSYEARSALDVAYQSKRKKLVDTFSDNEMKRFQEGVEKQEKLWASSLDIQRDQFDQLAQLSPLLGDQLAYKQKALDVEIQIGQAAFERKLIELQNAHIIEKSQADELRGLKAYENQLKRYALAKEDWAKQGIGGGMLMAASDLRKSAETWAAESTAALLKSMPQQVSSLMASSFVGFLQGKEMDFAQMGWTMAEATTQKLLEGILTQIIPTLADGVAGIFGGLLGDVGGGILDVAMGFFGFHHGSGGPVAAVYGHHGLAPNEYPAILLGSERVLSPEETRAYDAGARSGGGGGGFSVGGIYIDARGASKDIDWRKVTQDQIIPELEKKFGNHGEKFIPGRG